MPAQFDEIYIPHMGIYYKKVPYQDGTFGAAELETRYPGRQRLKFVWKRRPSPTGWSKETRSLRWTASVFEQMPKSETIGPRRRSDSWTAGPVRPWPARSRSPDRKSVKHRRTPLILLR